MKLSPCLHALVRMLCVVTSNPTPGKLNKLAEILCAKDFTWAPPSDVACQQHRTQGQRAPWRGTTGGGRGSPVWIS